MNHDEQWTDDTKSEPWESDKGDLLWSFNFHSLRLCIDLEGDLAFVLVIDEPIVKGSFTIRHDVLLFELKV